MPADAKPPKRGAELTKADGSTAKVKVVATPERRRMVMSTVCLECHSKTMTEGFMRQFDDVVELYNTKFGEPAAAIMASLYDAGLLTPLPFDEPLEFTYWELWHDEGARARHGASMMSPNHAWWEGMYMVGRNFYSRFLPEARAAAGDRVAKLVDAHIDGAEGHAWLARGGEGNPILGWMPPEPEPTPVPEQSPADEPAATEEPAATGDAAARDTDEAVTTAAAETGEAAAEEGAQ
jgi:hypothetical protein